MAVPITTVAVLARRASETASATSKSASSSTTSSSPSATPTEGGGNQNNSSQTPYLFFIALGLGIVFTNIWIVLGFRYCCRQRRQRLALEEAIRNGEVDPNTMEGARALDEVAMYLNPMYPARPMYRLRYDKRLLDRRYLDSIAPVQTYQEWKDSRAKGDTSLGGISRQLADTVAESRTASRPHSIRDRDQDEVDDGVSVHTSHSQQTISPERNGEGSSHEKQVSFVVEQEQEPEREPNVEQELDPEREPEPVSGSTTVPSSAQGKSDGDFGPDHSEHPDHEYAEHEHEHPDHDLEHSEFHQHLGIHEHEHDSDHEEHKEMIALQDLNAEGANGDVCSICLDQIDPPDNVRGLPCEHVFHDSCVTRWLTTRKGSCPLCKRDFCPRPVIPPRIQERLAENRRRAQAAAGINVDEPTGTAAPQGPQGATDTNQTNDNDDQQQDNGADEEVQRPPRARRNPIVRARDSVLNWWMQEPPSRANYFATTLPTYTR